jgi:hypothetical protein
MALKMRQEKRRRWGGDVKEHKHETTVNTFFLVGQFKKCHLCTYCQYWLANISIMRISYCEYYVRALFANNEVCSGTHIANIICTVIANNACAQTAISADVYCLYSHSANTISACTRGANTVRVGNMSQILRVNILHVHYWQNARALVAKDARAKYPRAYNIKLLILHMHTLLNFRATA